MTLPTPGGNCTVNLVIHWQDATGTHQWEPLHHPDADAGSAGVTARNAVMECRVTTRREDEYVILEHSLRMDVAARLVECVWHAATGLPDDAVLWHMTYDVWGRPGVTSARARPGHRPFWRAALMNPHTGRGHVCSYKLPARWMHTFSAAAGGFRIESRIDADVAAGGEWHNDVMALAFDVPMVHEPGGGRGLASSLAGPLSFHISRRHADDAAAHGAWNSWDYYKLDVRADDVRENLEAIKADETLRRFVKYIVVDDGWQTLDGEWEANDKFPGGMAALAAEIRAAGFVPGMWSAPFFINCNTKLFASHPEWCVQKGGAPYSPLRDMGCTGLWGDRYYLDPTHPAVHRHVRRMYEKFHGWGMRYFKTDFLSNPFKAAHDRDEADRGEALRFHDASGGLHQPHRQCMEGIRGVIGPESFWLGCGSIWATGAGLMDASRMSSDIAIYWPEIRTCAYSVFWNSHAHGALWLNDPDFLVVRGRDTSKPGMLDVPPEGTKPYSPDAPQSGPVFSVDEARTWAACVILSGGLVTLSDRIAGLNDEGMRIARTVCRLAGGPAARPLEFGRPLPRCAMKNGRTTLLACINWDETPAPALPRSCAAGVPDAAWTDAWTGRSFSTQQLSRHLLQPHCCLLLHTHSASLP